MTKFAFSLPSPKRERKLSDVEQAETKRPKSPGRQDVQQEERHAGRLEHGDDAQADRDDGQ